MHSPLLVLVCGCLLLVSGCRVLCQSSAAREQQEEQRIRSSSSGAALANQVSKKPNSPGAITESGGPQKQPVDVENLLESGAQDGEEDAERGESARATCRPKLDLVAMMTELGGRSAAASAVKVAENSTGGTTFAVADVDLPVARGDSTLDSAFRLLTSFSSQLAEETGDEGDNVLRFRDNQLQLQNIRLNMLNVRLYNLGEPSISSGVSIGNTTLTGRFTYDGPIYLAGNYRMRTENIYVLLSSNLTNLNQSLKTDQFQLNITNLGRISIDILDSFDQPTTNYLLRMMQRFLQKTIKRTYQTFEGYLRPALELELQRLVDCELERFTPLSVEQSATKSATNYQSQLANIIGSEILRLRLNSVALPDFEHNQSILGTQARVKFSNGTLSGLNNFAMSGETRIKLQEEHLFVNTSLGWKDLHPVYNWSLHVGSNPKTPLTKGFVGFKIETVEFDAVITKGLNKQQGRFMVEQLVIRKLDNPKMDVSGLPGMNRVTRVTVNFFMNRLKTRLTSSMQETLKEKLEESLNRVSFVGRNPR